MTISRWRMLAYAGGDFAFNLYWQSVMLYLLFYYTEALHLPLAEAATCYAVAMAWDGAASLGVGLWADRFLPPERHRAMIGWGAIPLGACFVLAYAPPLPGAPRFAWVLAGHLLFRTAYTLVNIPYLALSARLGASERDRALLAGWRMLAGTLAAVMVAVGTLPLGRALGGSGAGAYAMAAIAMALGGTAVLWLATLAAPRLPPAAMPLAHTARGVLGGAFANRAFVNLGMAMLAMIVAGTMIDKAVLYYFKYVLHDQGAGELALGWMMATGAIAVPCWMLLGRTLGIAAGWFVAVGLSGAALFLFMAGAIRSPDALRLFLVVVQAALVGLNFTLWALLPGVIERGERAAHVRMGAVIYGLFALIQRIAIGLGTLLLGLVLGRIRLDQNPEMLRLAIAALPLGFLIASAAIMLRNPLVRGGGKT